MKKFLLFSFCSLLCAFSVAFANPSPVVQVISYKEPLGTYFSLQGWGSGSIIDSAGHILTNNHVVDDGLGGISDDFSICLTEDPALPPKCNYTASVITRDPEKDIALLQIDPRDIFGNTVNLSTFTTLPIDYTYAPTTGDTVIARGYPWVGANTITETQGIVSGTYAYNNNTYIKTDTLIAGGNSGGPLVLNGKMIGVNTFLIGGSSDPSLGYSLSIREAQSFIQNALTLATHLQTNNPKFAPFLQTVTDASQKKQITDPLVTMNFPIKYNINTYIPGSYIDGQIAEESTTSVYGFSFLHFSVPALKTPEEIRYFLTGQSFFPFSQDVKFKSVTIGGQSFYEVDTLGNTAGDKSKTQYVYFKIVNQTHLILLELATPYSNETTYSTIQKNISLFLAGVSFPSQFTFAKNTPIDVADAGIKVVPTDGALVDFRGNFFPYNGVISQLMSNYQDLFTVRNYLGNLWSFAQISIVPNAFYTQGTTASDLLGKLKESPYLSQGIETNLVTYKWHDGFTVCDTTNTMSVFDEKNAEQFTTSCELILLIGKNNSHFLSLFYYTDKRHRAEIMSLMKTYLDTTLIFPEDGVTNFGTAAVKLTYTDVDDQSQEFRDSLKNLIKYGILSARSQFDGDHPLTWDEYVRLHIWMVYHKHLTDHIIPDDATSPTFEKILRTIPLDRHAYVDSNKRTNFELMLRMKLAGVKLAEYSEASLNQFQLQANTTYRDEWKKIENFEYLYFQGQKMGPNGATYYNPGSYTRDAVTYYNPITGLSSEPTLSHDALTFGVSKPSADDQKVLDTELACTQSSARYFSQACFKKRQAYVWSLLSYPVLTKGEAIDALLPSIDFALWDSELAKKKLVKIEQASQAGTTTTTDSSSQDTQN